MPDILVSKTMLDAIEKDIVHQGSFFRDKFFSNVYSLPTRTFIYDRVNEAYNSLPFAGYDAESTTDALLGYDTQSAYFEAIRHGHVITPYNLLDRLPGRTEYDNDNKIAELQNRSFAELERGLIRTEEKMAIQAITEGRVSVTKANGATDVLATYWSTPGTGDSSDPVMTLGTAWTSSTASGDILKDILNWKNKILEKGGSAPSILVVAANVGGLIASALLKTPVAMLNPGSIDVNGSYDEEGIQYIGQFAGLAIYSCGASLGGSPLLSSGTAILGGTGASRMMYGPTFIPTPDGMMQYVGRRSVYTKVSDDPVAYKNIIQSAPLPLIRRKWDNLYIKGIIS